MGESPQGQAGGGIQEASNPGGSQVRQPAPCRVCGEPRGDVTPCPHCGME